jgi:hypothetical protein
MSITATIGKMEWDACEECGHCDPNTGECKVSADMSDFELECDYVVCNAFATLEETEADEKERLRQEFINPNQLDLGI